MNLRIAHSILAASALTLLASLTGCVIVDKTGDTDTGTASVSSTSGEGSTTPTTGSGTSATSGDTGVTTEVPTSTDASATGDSTTGVDPALQAACEAACKVFLECQPDSYPDLATCAGECIDGAPGGPKCEAAATEFNNCIGGFTCDELNKALATEDFGACTEVFNAYIMSCNP